MKRATLILASLIVIFLCVGSPDYSKLWLDLNLGSLHGDEDYNVRDCSTCEKEVKDYNAFNPGLGLSYGVNDYLDLSVGGYYNSFEKASFYSGGELKYPIRIVPLLIISQTSSVVLPI